MVFGLSKEEREERKQERQSDKTAERIAKQKRREARRAGLIAGAQKEGYKEGREQAKRKGGTGFLGRLEGAAKFANKHIEIGPRKGGNDFDMGFRDPNGPSRIAANADDFSLGLGPRSKKSKKKDIYEEYGL